MEMSHIPVEQWQRYVDDHMTPEEREQCDSHLNVCDLCLALYMQCLEQAEARLPQPENEAVLADAAMKRFDEYALNKLNTTLTVLPAACSKPRLPLIQHPFFHYAVAAVITLILMGSGVFHTITQQIAYIEPAGKAEEPLDASFSKKLMDQTIGMLDSIQPKRERGSTHEFK